MGNSRASASPVFRGHGKAKGYQSAGFSCRVAEVLRDPPATFRQAFALESRRPRRVDDGDGTQGILRLTHSHLVAFSRLLLLATWETCVIGRQGVTRLAATQMFLWGLSRRGIQTSKSSLYRLRGLFLQRGLLGLVPIYHGIRGRRIPAAELAVILNPDQHISDYDRYLAARKKAKLFGKPVSPATVRRVRKDPAVIA